VINLQQLNIMLYICHTIAVEVVVANVLRLGVCYFALQTFQALDKIYRQNNSTKPLLVAGAV
jgi:uncharacterized membrane protein YwzB